VLYGLLVSAAFRPAPAIGLVRRVFGRFPRLARAEAVAIRSIDRLARLRRCGGRALGWVLFAQLLYFACFSMLGVVLMEPFGGAIDVRAFAANVVYVAFTYLAPTPGAAGLAEAMAIPFFGPLLGGKAVPFVLCYRALMLYLQVGFGVPYMVIIGGLGEVVRRAQPRSGGS
jgi:hypothetical protein